MDSPNDNDDEIGLKELIERLHGVVASISRGRRLLKIPVAVCVGLGLFVAFGSRAEYTAFSRLVPYRSGSSSSGLSGLASLAGVRLPAAAATDIVITTELYPEVATTFDFQTRVAETPIVFSGTDSLVSAASYFDSQSQLSPVELVTRYTFGLPNLLMSALQTASSKKTEQHRNGRAIGPKRVDPNYRKVVLEVGRRIKVDVERKTGVISVSAQMPDPVAAADLVRATADRLTQTVIEYEVRKADEQLRFVEEQHSESKARYNMAQLALAAFLDRNRTLVSATAQIERSRLEREAEIAFEVYQQFVREREQARIKRNQDTPVFSVLEQPTVPTERSSPHRTKILALSFIIGSLIGLVRIWQRSLNVPRVASR